MREIKDRWAVSHGDGSGGIVWCVAAVRGLSRPVIRPEETLGDSDDWETVYVAHSLRLIRLATVLVGPDDAPDLVSEAVRRAVHQPGWTSVRDQGAYLVTSLVNESRQLHRSRSRRRAREQRAARLVPQPLVAHGQPAPADLDVRAALEALSPQQRAVVFLTYWEDRTIPQVAHLLDVSPGTVRKQLDRAKTKLKRVLDA
jgi:RNA polymerase sigma-70 factor (ECF subfamily)